MTSLSAIAISVKIMLLVRTNEWLGNGFHSIIMKKVMNAPINTFFDITPVGKIIVRFTKDLDVFKGGLFWSVNHLSNMIFSIIQIVFVLLYASPLNAIPLLLIFSLCRVFIKPYLATDNQLHKVSQSVWTPIHSFWQEVLRGGTVIRAFRNDKQFLEREMEMMDRTTLHFIAHHSCWVWLNLRIYYTTQLAMATAVVACLTLKGRVDNVLLAMLLTYTLDLNWVQHLFGCLNWLERNAIHCERLFNLTRIEQEAVEGETKVQDDWVKEGSIEFSNVTLRYRKNTDIALNELSFKVKAGSKVGICGRTGAGKSTVSMALSRIVEIEGGQISIDGVDISKIDMGALRNKVTVIPQDPTLFTGTLRYNLDPFNEASDERIIELLKRAKLEYLLQKEQAPDKDEKQASTEAEEGGKTKQAGLNFKVTENGGNLAVGEKQLLCIVRAILRNNKVVLLDEATANIDVVTEETIQKLIHEEF